MVRDADRQVYIAALEAADAGDLGPLVAYFARRQRDAILKALGLEQQVRQGRYAEQIISSALQVLKNRFSKEQKKVSAVYEHAAKLLAQANDEFRAIATSLDPQLRALTPPTVKAKYRTRSGSADDTSDQRHYFQKQILDIANHHFHYFVNFESYRAWVRITLTTDQDFDYVVSFHGYGPGETGILTASAFTYVKAPREDGGTEPVAIRPAATELFQFNYAESFDTVGKRFADWLEGSKTIALAEWKRSLQTGV